MGLPVMIAMGVVQAGIAVGSAIAQGEENSRAQAINDAELARAARMEEANAIAAEARGAILAGRARMRGTQVREEARLAFAASGVDGTVGTPTTLDAATSAAAESEAQEAVLEASQRAFGHRETSRRYGVQRSEGRRRYEAGQSALAFNTVASASSSILGGVASGLSYAKGKA